MASKRYTEQQLRELTPLCDSIADLLRRLGLKERGGNYKTMLQKLAQLSIDTSHFTGQAHNKGKTFPHRVKDYTEYLVDGSTVKSYKLKLVLLREGVLHPVCSCCGLSTWLEGPIPLELDHINGKNDDNRIENLRLLCPNCHALTPTYRGKNQKK